MESSLPPPPPPHSPPESVAASAEDLMPQSMEERVFNLSQELTQTDPSAPALSDDEIITKLNVIAETLEEVEATFRKERSSPSSRRHVSHFSYDSMWIMYGCLFCMAGHLIGNLLQELAQNEDFYPMLEEKLSDLSGSRVKAATCRLLLATVPVNSRAIVRMLDVDDEMLDRVCGFAPDADPALRCYATGLLSVGLQGPLE
ncbi:unnamed protein product [Hyaloperonospora brassicae]|uniref:Uncharacterized protein n=1 Tax=Hyaloperonospora brassicae TaxID=162125 RepID=A0AAV0UCJ7_HYABA|nr:unnamed protein product [Hyaloperonospora brassicae]